MFLTTEYNDIFINNWKQYINDDTMLDKISWNALVQNYKLPVELIRELSDRSIGLYLDLSEVLRYQILTEDEIIQVLLIFLSSVEDITPYILKTLNLYQINSMTPETLVKIKTMIELVKDC